MKGQRLQKICFLLLFIAPFYAKGQLCNDPFLNIDLDTTHINSKNFEAGSTGDLGSNAFTGKLYNAIFNSGFIGDDAKNSVLPYLKGSNNDLGAYLNNYIYYSWKPRELNTRFYVRLSSRIQYTALFSPDVYKLVFFGNQMFAGKTADISGFRFNHYAYQSLQFGAYKYRKESGDNILLYGGGVSLVSGAGYNSLSVPRGNIYTSPDGDSISLDVKIASKGVTPASMITDINGLGASVNGFLAYKFLERNELRFEIEDLGFVDWFKNNGQFNIDKQISYTGEKVSVINGKTTFTQYYQTLDTIATQAGHPSVGNSFISGLPFQLHLTYTRYLNTSWAVTGGVEYINDNMKIPEIDLLAQKALLRSKLSAALGISVFGYSNYGVTAGIKYKFNNKLGFTIGTQHLEGLSSIPGTHGEGYYANLQWAI